MSDPVWSVNQAIGGRLALGASFELDGGEGVAGEVTVSGYGAHMETSGFELTIDPQVFVSGNYGATSDFTRTTLGAGGEVSVLRDVGPYSPVFRASVGVGASLRSGDGTFHTNPAFRAAVTVDVPIVPTSFLSTGLWLSPQVAFVDDAVELTLGFHGTLPTGS